MDTKRGWLFTRGSQSIQLIREEHSTGCRLLIHGPGTEIVTLDFGDVTECMRGQATIERSLYAEGYQLTQLSSDRRSQGGAWQGGDQRRAGTKEVA
jgi:hypothetical protein